MSNDADSTPQSISLRSDRSLSVGGNSLISRGLQDLAGLTAAPPSMPSVQTDDIHEAATKGDIGAVRRILNADPAKVDAKDDEGWTPLHCAVCYDHPAIADLLLNRAANRDAKLRGGESRIREAMGERQLMLFYFDVFCGATPLHLAALLGRDASVNMLLSAGASA
jgi:ankyrin repeat protein